MNVENKNSADYNTLKLLEAEFQQKLNRYSVLSKQLTNNLMVYYSNSKSEKNMNISVTQGQKATGMKYLGCIKNDNGNGLNEQTDMNNNVSFESCKQRAEDLGAMYFTKVGRDKSDFPNTPWSNSSQRLGTCPDGYTLTSDKISFITQETPDRIAGGLYINGNYYGYDTNSKKWRDGVSISGKFVDAETNIFYNLSIFPQGNTLYVNASPSFNSSKKYVLYKDNVWCESNKMPSSCPGKAHFGEYNNNSKAEWANLCKTSWYNKDDLNKGQVATLPTQGVNAYISNNKSLPGIDLTQRCYVGSINSSDVNIEMSNKCSLDNNKNNIGNNEALAIYELEGISENLVKDIGKVGYVDFRSKLHEYPENMIKLGNSYENVPNYDSVGNDLKKFTNVNAENCKNECNKVDDCYGFVYNRNNNSCFIKNKNMYPKGLRIANNNTDIYIRNKNVNNNKSCNKKVTNVDVKAWNGFTKDSKMTMETLCGLGKALDNNTIKNEIAELEDELKILAKKIKDEMKKLSNTDESLVNELENDKIIMDRQIKEYEYIRNKIKENRHTTNTIMTYDAQMQKSDMAVNMNFTKLLLYGGLSAMVLFSIFSLSRKRQI